jgi:hypothetical protein
MPSRVSIGRLALLLPATVAGRVRLGLCVHFVIKEVDNYFDYVE